MIPLNASAPLIGQKKRPREDDMITRRILLEGTGTTLVASSFGLPPLFAKAAGLELSPNLPDGTRAEAVLESLPEKKPLIKLSYRPGRGAPGRMKRVECRRSTSGAPLTELSF